MIVEQQTQKMRLAAGPLSHGVVVKELCERPLVGKVMRVPWRAVVDGLGARWWCATVGAAVWHGIATVADSRWATGDACGMSQGSGDCASMLIVLASRSHDNARDIEVGPTGRRVLALLGKRDYSDDDRLVCSSRRRRARLQAAHSRRARNASACDMVVPISLAACR